jgi:hypothetical protein
MTARLASTISPCASTTSGEAIPLTVRVALSTLAMGRPKVTAWPRWREISVNRKPGIGQR